MSNVAVSVHVSKFVKYCISLGTTSRKCSNVLKRSMGTVWPAHQESLGHEFFPEREGTSVHREGGASSVSGTLAKRSTRGQMFLQNLQK